MNKSGYTAVAMRGGIGDIFLYSLKVWGNGFWKYFFISFFFIVPLIMVIQLGDFFLLFNNLNYSNINSLTSFFSYVVISVVCVTYFFCLSFGSNSYLAGKLATGESPSIANALSRSFKRSGSYFIYTILFVILSVILSFISLWIINTPRFNSSEIELLNGVALIIIFILILLLPFLILIFPAMTYMRANIFRAFKSISSLLKSYYSRAIAMVIVCFLLAFISFSFFSNLVPLNDDSKIIIEKSIYDEEIQEEIKETKTEEEESTEEISEEELETNIVIKTNIIYNVLNTVITIFAFSILYSFASVLFSLTFLNVWASKLKLENLYAVKILSAALNMKKIPRAWYRNKDVDKIEGKVEKKKASYRK